MKIFDPLPKPKTLSLMPTYQCTAACKNCGTLSNPSDKTALGDKEFLAAITQAADANYDLVVFTGGEPTLAGSLLLKGVSLASEKGLRTRVVTNGHWARCVETAEKRVAELVCAGLDEINFSTGDEHIRFVPLDNVLRGLCAAVDAKLVVALMIETTRKQQVSRETVEQHPIYQELLHTHPGAKVRIRESPWMPLNPRTVGEYSAESKIDFSNVDGCRGCDSILNTMTVMSDGTLGACCGLGLRLVRELHLGNITTTTLADAEATASNDFLKRWIRVDGPEKILAWAALHDTSIEWEGMYAHRCQACLRLYKDPKVRQVIREHHLEESADLVMSEWLLYECRDVESANTNQHS